MKVLFLDQSAELQQKCITPLRSEGWGALRASSVEDADRMMVLHGDSVEVIVVNEKFAEWPKRWDVPYVVLTHAWSDAEVLKHQNANRPAFSYVSFKSISVSSLIHTLNSRVSHELQATGSDSRSISIAPEKTQSTGQVLSLESFSGVMAKPERTLVREGMSSIILEAPSILLGGTLATGQLSSLSPSDVAEKPAAQPELRVVTATFNEDVGNKTLVLDVTSVEMNEVKELSEVGEMDFSSVDLSPDLEPVSEVPVQPVYAQPVYAQPIYSQPVHSQPVTNQFAINPTPNASPSDIETLRSYLSLREQDVAILSGQMRSSQERIQQLEMQLKLERARGNELQHSVQKQEQTLKNYDQDKQVEVEVLYQQVEDMNRQLKERTDKVRLIETKLKFTVEEVQKVKDRVRVDIRRIRVREKELENQIEVLKKDSSALLLSRDEKIIELKRKIDLLEFNMELVQEQYARERGISEQLRNRLKDALQAARQSVGFLDSEA